MPKYDKYYQLLVDNEATCLILHQDTIIFQSTKRGVAPMIDFYQAYNTMYNDLVVVDKIMGRGAIILAQLIGAKTIITPIISTPAKVLASAYNLTVSYKTEVDAIRNRNNDGNCPIETSVLDITDPIKGYHIIRETLANLS